MALAFNLLLAAATPSLVVSPMASPIPAPPTSGGLNVLPILLAVLVVILLILILILALRLGGRRQDSTEPDLEQPLVPVAPHTPDDGVNPQEREIYRAQPTPFATQPAPAAADTPAPVPYQPAPPPEPAVPQQPPPLPSPPQPAGMPLPPPDPALYQPPTEAPTAYPPTTLAPWATSPPGPSAQPEPAPARAPLRTPEPFPSPIASAPAAEPEPTAIDPAPGTMDPLPPSPVADLAPAAPAAPPVIPRPEPAPEAQVVLPPAQPPPVEPVAPTPVPTVSPEPIPGPGPEATPGLHPSTPPEPALPEPSVPAPIAPQPAEGQLILLIEDDERIARFYTILFEAKGYLVRNARDGIEGVDLATALKPALILLDVMMPKMNGLMVLQTLRANPETEHTPVVVLSNYMEPPLIQRALQLGAIEYVVKSQARPEQLVNAVPSWLIGEPALH